MTLNWLDTPFGTTTNDLTFTNDVTGRRLLINSVHPLSDGRTPSRREREVAKRTVHNGAPGDIVAIIPLPADGEPLDKERLKAVLEPLLEELENPPPPDDPRDTTPPGHVVRERQIVRKDNGATVAGHAIE